MSLRTKRTSDDLALRIAVRIRACALACASTCSSDYRTLDGDLTGDFGGVPPDVDRISAPYVKPRRSTSWTTI